MAIRKFRVPVYRSLFDSLAPLLLGFLLAFGFHVGARKGRDEARGVVELTVTSAHA